MLEIEATGRGGIRYPTDQCCNCGTQAGELVIEHSVLRATMFLGVVGAEQRMTVPLPYCEGCVATAHRLPMGFGGTVLVWIFLCVIGVIAATYFPWLRALGIRGVLLLDAGLAAALIWTWRRIVARPRGEQTSHYQPVRLHDFGRVLAFTHNGYGERVLADNPGVCTLVSTDIADAQLRNGTRGERARAWLRRTFVPSRRTLRNALTWAVMILVTLAMLWILGSVR